MASLHQLWSAALMPLLVNGMLAIKSMLHHHMYVGLTMSMGVQTDLWNGGGGMPGAEAGGRGATGRGSAAVMRGRGRGRRGELALAGRCAHHVSFAVWVMH